MVFDYKKEYKEFYMPKNKPSIVEIPKIKPPNNRINFHTFENMNLTNSQKSNRNLPIIVKKLPIKGKTLFI